MSGTIRFTDIAGAPHPARRTQVELRETTVSSSEVVATVSTDDAGRYQAKLDKPVGAADLAHAGGHNLFVRALATGPGYSVESPAGDVHRIDSGVVKGVRNGSAVTIDLTANNTADNNTAFSVGDAMLDVHDYMVKIGTPVPAIAVEFPSSLGCSCFGRGKLFMLRGDRFDYGVAHHEYSHYVSREFGIESNPGGEHNSLDQLSETRGSKDIGVRLAWGEAWPTCFGTSLQRALNSATRGIPSVGDTRYSDTDDLNFSYDLETGDGRPSLGEDAEVAVQRVIWDVYDSGREPRRGEPRRRAGHEHPQGREGDDVLAGVRRAHRRRVAPAPRRDRLPRGGAEDRAGHHGPREPVRAPRGAADVRVDPGRRRSEVPQRQLRRADLRRVVHDAARVDAEALVDDLQAVGRQAINVVVRATRTAPP